MAHTERPFVTVIYTIHNHHLHSGMRQKIKTFIELELHLFLGFFHLSLFFVGAIEFLSGVGQIRSSRRSLRFCQTVNVCNSCLISWFDTYYILLEYIFIAQGILISFHFLKISYFEPCNRTKTAKTLQKL
jgi:hypothetical protein